MKRAMVGLVSMLALARAGAALADPRLDEVVYTPYVENGEAEFEVRTARQLGGPSGGDMTTVLEGEYGLNDRLSLALVGTLERSPGQALQLTGVGLEAVTYLGQIPGLGVDAGGYLEYTQGLRGEPDVIEGKVLLAKQVQRFQGLLNLIVERPLSGPGEARFASYGYAASATWRTVGALRLGAEAFGDLGTDHAFGGAQGAYVGPQVLWEGRPGHAPVEIGVDAGWLFPVGTDRAEARSQWRISLELEHRF
ncbi:MAG TPA: hypothetical protein VGI30_08730 [Caulobacteraceae bacterium]